VTARLLNTDEAAEYLGVSAPMIRRLIARGEIPVVRIGRRLLVDRNDIDVVVEKWKRSSSCEPNATLSAASIKGWRSREKRGAA
jgi:excisionase family DNA binding protein